MYNNSALYTAINKGEYRHYLLCVIDLAASEADLEPVISAD